MVALNPRWYYSRNLQESSPLIYIDEFRHLKNGTDYLSYISDQVAAYAIPTCASLDITKPDLRGCIIDMTNPHRILIERQVKKNKGLFAIIASSDNAAEAIEEHDRILRMKYLSPTDFQFGVEWLKERIEKT